MSRNRIAIVAVVVLVGLTLVYRPLLFSSVDPEIAAARGVPIRRLSVGGRPVSDRAGMLRLWHALRRSTTATLTVLSRSTSSSRLFRPSVPRRSTTSSRST